MFNWGYDMKYINKEIKVIGLSFLFSIIVCFINFDFKADEFKPGYWIYDQLLYSVNQKQTILYFVFGVLIFFVYSKIIKKTIKNKIRIYIIIFSQCMSFVIYLCKSYYLLSSWALMFSSVCNFLFSITFIVLGGIILNYILLLCYLVLEKFNLKNSFYYNSKQHWLVYSFILFFLINSVYLLAFYPGTATYDGCFQIAEYYGYRDLSNHLPVMATLIEGAIFNIGSKFGGQNFGLFTYVFLQTLFQSYIFAYAVKVIACITHNKILTVFTILFFVVNPLFPIWGICFVKDTMYYIAFLWMVLIIIEIAEKWYTNEYIMVLQLFLATLIVCIFRNNGLYVVLPSLLLLMFFIKNNKKIKLMILVNCVLLSVLFIGWSKILTIYNVPQPVEEALSIPFQQTARLYWEDKEINANDDTVIQNIFQGKNLKELYNPELADPVKFSFKWGKENRKLWKEIYLKYFTKYPTVYVEAFLNQNYGYLYPLKKATDIGTYVITKDAGLHSDKIILNNTSPFNRLRVFLCKVPQLYIEWPVLCLIYNCSFYMWTILFLTGLLLVERKISSCILGIPLLLSIGVCFLSPLDACIRYMLSIIVVFPVFVSYFIFKIKET